MPELPGLGEFSELSGEAGAEFDLGAFMPGQEPHAWQEFETHIRRDGQLMLTPYGVRWREYTARSGAIPQKP